MVLQAYEGERATVKDNTLLGKIKLVDLPSALKGEVQASVIFKVDQSGILYVSAHEKTQNNFEKMKITKSLLSESQRKQLANDGERYKDEDTAIRKCLGKRIKYLFFFVIPLLQIF